jgi:hypothetical protein
MSCVKVYTKKDGTVIEKVYDQKVYSATHYQKHKEKYAVRYDCECGGTYSITNKHNHLKTQIHTEYMKKT